MKEQHPRDHRHRLLDSGSHINAPVQRWAAQRTGRCNRWLGGRRFRLLVLKVEELFIDIKQVTLQKLGSAGRPQAAWGWTT